MFKKLFAAMIAAAGIFVAVQAQAGTIEISDIWVKASIGKAPNSAAFFIVTNKGPADKIVDVTSDLAKRTELHTHIMENNIMKMRRVAGGVDVPANGSVAFKPGSYHVMLIGLHAPLKVGEKVSFTLHFQNAGDVPVTADVKPALGMNTHGNQSGKAKKQ